MICPSCSSEMQGLMVGKIEIDRCPNCIGIFLDGGELGAILLDPAAQAAAARIDMRRVSWEPSGEKGPCPRCGAAMSENFYGGGTKMTWSDEANSIRIDSCGACRGVFLDRGELSRILDLNAKCSINRERDRIAAEGFRLFDEVRIRAKPSPSRETFFPRSSGVFSSTRRPVTGPGEVLLDLFSTLLSS